MVEKCYYCNAAAAGCALTTSDSLSLFFCGAEHIQLFLSFPCHNKWKKDWCDKDGLGCFMGHTCQPKRYRIEGDQYCEYCQCNITQLSSTSLKLPGKTLYFCNKDHERLWIENSTADRFKEPEKYSICDKDIAQPGFCGNCAPAIDMRDPVAGNYYRRTIKGVQIELYDIIDAFGLDFYQATTICYVMRAGVKNDNAAEDIKKTIKTLKHYLKLKEEK